MRTAIFLLFTTTYILSFGQERCGTKSAHVHSFENWLSSRIRYSEQERSESGGRTQATVYTIPVVVHIVEPANENSLEISDERIVRQVEILSEDFRRTNADALNTPATFLPVAADTEIQFSLAKRDPAGNPTNGIVRVRGARNRYNPLDLDHKSSLRMSSFWPPAHYLNIYVTDLSGFLGFASFPTTTLAGIENEEDDFIFDAILVDFQYFGENPAAPSFASVGRTTTHEVGHYLGLRHIWGDGGCSIDDFVLDTPPADTDNDGLGSPCDFPNLADPTVCVTDEMFQNYMDYTNDVCMNLFTEGQKTRMRTVLENAPRRNSLLTSPALSPPARFTNDLAIKRINAPSNVICSNQMMAQVEVVNVGTNEVTSYEISLSIDGIVAQTINQTTSMDTFAIDTVNFTSEFISSTPREIEFSITLVNAVADGNPSNNVESITLASTSSILTPFVEDFETTNALFGEFGPSNSWEVLPAPDQNPSNQALAFKAFNNTSSFDEETLFLTPVFDLTGIVSAGIIFDHAHARRPDGFRDGLAVKVSRDCGVTFDETPIYLDFGDSLETASETDDLFIPAGEMDWETDTISLVEVEDNANVDGIQFAFIGLNGGGNHIYLDNISIQQIDKNPNDASITGVEAARTTCNEMASVNFQVRNVGFEEITSIGIDYTINNNNIIETISNILIPVDQIRTFSIDIPVNEGENNLMLEIPEVNGLPDEDLSKNTFDFVVIRDNLKDLMPLIVDFENTNTWTITPTTSTQLWNHSTTGSQNNVLVANGFNQPQEGIEDWFISPELLLDDLDSVGLSFKVSHAERIGFSDRLQVLMSRDCGETYNITLFDAFSDSLAVTQTDDEWSPTSEADWRTFEVDLNINPIFDQDEMRIAFVFTNGNGNNLFLDDINIGIVPDLSANDFIVFPNPYVDRFNIAFSLTERDDVDIKIFDIAGRLVYQDKKSNVIDQVYDIRVPQDFSVSSQGGFYFVKIVGSKINKTERLYIRQ